VHCLWNGTCNLKCVTFFSKYTKLMLIIGFLLPESSSGETYFNTGSIIIIIMIIIIINML